MSKYNQVYKHPLGLSSTFACFSKNQSPINTYNDIFMSSHLLLSLHLLGARCFHIYISKWIYGHIYDHLRAASGGGEECGEVEYIVIEHNSNLGLNLQCGMCCGESSSNSGPWGVEGRKRILVNADCLCSVICVWIVVIKLNHLYLLLIYLNLFLKNYTLLA